MNSEQTSGELVAALAEYDRLASDGMQEPDRRIQVLQKHRSVYGELCQHFWMEDLLRDVRHSPYAPTDFVDTNFGEYTWSTMGKFNQPIEAVVFPDGTVQPLAALRYAEPRRAILVVLDEAPAADVTRIQFPPPRKDRWQGRRFGNYVIQECIGKGGMGVAYRACDVRDSRVVCLKLLKGFTRKSSLLQECKSLARLDHPSIVRLLDYGGQANMPYLVTEFVQGTTLLDFARDRDQLSAALVTSIGKLLFDALAYAHAQDVIHCDLKPANILVLGTPVEGETPAIRIIDFGLAVVEGEDDAGCETAMGRFAGTPVYMAPEQMRHHMLSGAVDVYAMGLILWQLLTKKLPFRNEHPREMLSAKNELHEGLALDGIVSEIPDYLANLIKLCTHPDIRRRPSAAEALKMLDGH